MPGTVLVASPIAVLARESGLHPDVVRRLIALGLIDPLPPFAPDAAARLACAVRLRRDLGLSWAGAVLACELLGRISELEARLRRVPSRPLPEVSSWIQTA
jgi:hypothetical protein